METSSSAVHREPWDKEKGEGQKAPFKLKDNWAIRVRLQVQGRTRELALLNLGVDSKLRGCELVSLKVCDVCHGDQIGSRAIQRDSDLRARSQEESYQIWWLVELWVLLTAIALKT